MSGPGTIYALSSGRPPVAIAVVRFSGPDARSGLERLIGRVPVPRQTALARVSDPQTGERIDQAIALWFPGPASETGEDVAELHLHGGRAVIAATLQALSRLPGFRPAEPGEFARRAFANGKIDLTQVEGLADLIGAETEAQRRQAMRQLLGQLGTRAEHWRGRIIEALALVEAGIDFADEGDVPAGLVAPAVEIARALHAELQAVLAEAGRGERLREGLVVAIAGPPNAGKSSLFNYLARRDAAIVSPYPGTTRDVLEIHLDLGGFPVTVLDTAGIRAAADPVEQEGIDRARRRAAQADLVLWVTDASAEEGRCEARGSTVWAVRNKSDLNESDAKWVPTVPTCAAATFDLSVRTGQGLEALLGALVRHAEETLGGAEAALMTRARHRGALQEAADALDRAVQTGGGEEVLAEELRLSARALGRLTGRVDVEDILDKIFRDFCIGK